jgi:phosphoadenosine phosphosulfate reductase
MTSPEIIAFKQKKSLAKETIKNILIQAKNPCICFSGGIKSQVILHLIKSVAKQPLQVIFIDTTFHFDEIFHYVEKMRKLWGFHLVKGAPHELPDRIAEDTDYCCNLLIGTPLKELIQKNRYDYVFIGTTSADKHMSGLIATDSGNMEFTVVSPIDQFTPEDIWQYIHEYNLPFCSLYTDGYNKVDCKPCSRMEKTNQKNNHKPDEEEQIKEKLKKLGYL